MPIKQKYLETKDPPLHSKVKAIIKDCADRNRRKEAGFESVTGTYSKKLNPHGYSLVVLNS